MRIVGGRLKGRVLSAPASREIRPTSERLRESIFDILAHRFEGAVEGSRVVDLFAGSGALAIEALSRGAQTALLVDNGSEARALLRANVEALALGGVTRIWRADATRLGKAPAGPPFNLAFLDPPYGKGLAGPALAALVEGGWLAEGALVVVEEAAKAEIAPPEGLRIVDEREYGDTRIVFWPLPIWSNDRSDRQLRAGGQIMINLFAIAQVVGGRAEPEDDNWGASRARIELDPARFAPDALAGLDAFSHVEIVYVFDRVAEADVVSGARHPRGRKDWPKVGIFAQRGKNRPNRIGVTICRVCRGGRPRARGRGARRDRPDPRSRYQAGAQGFPAARRGARTRLGLRDHGRLLVRPGEARGRRPSAADASRLP